MKKSHQGIPELLFLFFTASMADSRSEMTVVVGGLFPIPGSNPGKGGPCDSRRSDIGYGEVRAFNYTIEAINANFSYWNFRMEGVMLDSCDTESHALEQSKNFLENNCDEDKICAVVGATRREEMIDVANLFSLHQIPHVSYSSSSPKLDDKVKYPNFFRVVPSDKFVMKAIFDILVEFGWNYVSMVFSEDDYGENCTQYIRDDILNTQYIRDIGNTTKGLSLAALEILPKSPKHKDFSRAVLRLLKHEKAKVVVVFLNEEMTWELLARCKELYISDDRFVWIFNQRLEGFHHFNHTEGSITLFSRWFPVEDPFFESNFTQDKNIPMVIDSVFLLASAIRNFCIKNQDLCHTRNNSKEIYKKITDFIANTRIDSSQGHNITVSFDENRNVPAQYAVYQYRRSKSPPY